jgi:hypothetical protein
VAGRVETVGGNQKNNHITCPGLENLDVIWHKSRFRTGRIGRLAPVGGELLMLIFADLQHEKNEKFIWFLT